VSVGVDAGGVVLEVLPAGVVVVGVRLWRNERDLLTSGR
jgi:hypothetical protein